MTPETANHIVTAMQYDRYAVECLMKNDDAYLTWEKMRDEHLISAGLPAKAEMDRLSMQFVTGKLAA